MSLRHFLDLKDLPAATLRAILDHAARMKAGRAGWPTGKVEPDMPGRDRVLAMIFEKPSTRTRLSFDAAIRQLGGSSMVLRADDLQLGRGETIADTARIFSRMVDAVMLRTSKHENLLELARNASIPVINGLTDDSHPCQIMADLLTFEEKLGPVKGHKIAWVGDGNNVAASWIHAAVKFGFRLDIACPPGLRPADGLMHWAQAHAGAEGGSVHLSNDPAAAVADAACVVADTWVSMGQDEETNRRHAMLEPYRVDGALMAKAAPKAIFMHCLPAHRGEEVTPEVIDGPQSVVFDEAENRLHAQKAILAWCFNG